MRDADDNATVVDVSIDSPRRGAGEAGLVSVILSTHNRADLLMETLASVQAQTYSAWEAVVVDDGSTDHTRTAVERLAAADGRGRIRYIHQENAGAQVARNRGMAESRGAYILFLDSDDLLHPDKLRLQVKGLKAKSEIDFCVGRILDFSDSAKLPAIPVAPTVETIRGLDGFRGGGFFLIHAPLFRRSALGETCAWDAGVIFGHETNFFGCALARGLCGVTIPTAIAYRREHAARYSVGLSEEEILAGHVRNYEGICRVAEIHGTRIPPSLRWTLLNDRANLHILHGTTQAARDDLAAAAAVVGCMPRTSRWKLTLRRMLLAVFGATVYRIFTSSNHRDRVKSIVSESCSRGARAENSG